MYLPSDVAAHMRCKRDRASHLHATLPSPAAQLPDVSIHSSSHAPHVPCCLARALVILDLACGHSVPNETGAAPNTVGNLRVSVCVVCIRGDVVTVMLSFSSVL